MKQHTILALVITVVAIGVAMIPLTQNVQAQIYSL